MYSFVVCHAVEGVLWVPWNDHPDVPPAMGCHLSEN